MVVLEARSGKLGRELSVWWVAVLVLSLLSLVLRVFAIDHDSLWFDEAVTARLVKVPASDFITGRAYDIGNPPFYWIFAGFWSVLFGDSEAGLRSFPAVCGVLTVPFLAVVGRQLVSPKVGLWGAFLLAISPTAIELSNEARAYALAGLLSVVATWLFIRWVETNRWLDLAFYSLVVFLVCSTHYYGGAIPLAHAASLATLGRDRRRFRSWLGAMAVAGLLGLSMLNVLVLQMGTKGNLSRMGERSMIQFLATPMVFGFGRSLAWRESPAWVLGALTLAALACFWCPAVFALVRWRRNRFGAVLLGSWSLIPIIVPLIVAATLSPIYATRYAFVGLPPFLMLTASGLEEFRPAVRGALVLPMLVLTSMSLYCYGTRPLNDDWRSETQFVLDRWKPGELICFEPDQEIETFLYYVPRYGAAPPEMVAVFSGPSSDGLLRGMRYRDGVRYDRLPRNCADSVSASSGVWLVLCASTADPDVFRNSFARNGLQLVDRRRSHRIEILHFTREIGPVRFKQRSGVIR